MTDATPRCISSFQQVQSLLLFIQTVDGLCLSVYRYVAAVDFIHRPVQADSAQYLLLKFLYSIVVPHVCGKNEVR